MVKETYPILYCDTRAILVDFLRSREEAEADIEIPDIQGEDYLAWDARGFRVRLLCRDSSGEPGWLEVEVLGDQPDADREFLENLITQFGKEQGVDIRPAPGETLLQYAERVDERVSFRKWTERAWWRRLLGLPNR